MPEAPEPAPAAPDAPAPEGPSVGDSLSDAFRVVLDRPQLFIGLWLCTAAPAEALSYGFKQWAGHGTKEGLRQAFASDPKLIAIYALVLFVGLVAHLISQAAVVTAAAEQMSDRRADFKESLNRGLERLPALLWTSIVVGLRIVGGIILLIVPGIIMAIRYSLADYATIFEGVTGGAAAARSRELVLSRMWDVVVMMLAVAVVTVLGTAAVLLLDVFAAVALGLVGLKAALPLVIAFFACLASLVSAWNTAAFTSFYLRLAALPPATKA
jgi:hypothetical protein